MIAVFSYACGAFAQDAEPPEPTAPPVAPAPAPEPEPEAAPAPAPATEAAPEPAPAPEVAPEPAPAPQVAPEPEPAPDGGEDPGDAVEEVVVTGTRTERRLGDSPVAVEVISRQEIARSGATDASQVLETHPGVDIQRDQFGATVRLRGLDANQVLVLVDGQRLVGRTGGATNLGRIPVEDIERIEIVKGPSSALYGSDALGGVVQIVTRAPDRPSANVDLRGGAYVGDVGGLTPNADLSGSASAGKGPVAGRITLGAHSQPVYDRDPTTPRTTTSGRDEWLIGGRVDLKPNPDAAIPVDVQYTLTNTRGVDENGLAVLDRHNATEDARITVRPSLLGERSRTGMHVGLSLFRDQFLYDQRGGADLDQYQETRELLLQVSPQRDQVIGSGTMSQTLSLGADLFASAIASDRLTDGGGSRLSGAVFVQDEWRIAKKPLFAVVPGFRFDADTWFGTSPNPRLAVRFDPVSPVTLRASAGTGFRAPTFRELLLTFDNPGVGYRVTGNPDLRPERSVTVDAAVEWDPVRRFGASVAGWWTELDDLINFVVVPSGPGTAIYSYDNVDEARTRGVEGTVRVAPLDDLRLSASYTFTDAVDLVLDRPLSGRQKHRATVDASGTISPTSTELSGRVAYVGPSVVYADDNLVVAGTDVPDGNPVAGYALVDARIDQRLTRDLHLYTGVSNLLDAGDTEFVLLAPRLWYAGLTARAVRRKPSEGT